MNFSMELKNLAAFKNAVDALAKRNIPYAIANALNSTAWEAKNKIVNVIESVFDRPTRYVKKSVVYSKASVSSLFNRVGLVEPSEFLGAIVDGEIKLHKDQTGGVPPASLAPHVFGGPRTSKGSEKNLRFGYSHRRIFGEDQYITPGPGAKRDRHGNIAGGEMVRIKSGAGIAEHFQGYEMNITPRSRKRNKKALLNLFVVPRVGVFRKLGPNTIVPMLYFSRRPHYNKRFKFYEESRGVFNARFVKNMNDAWNRALTAAVARGKL